MFIFQDKACAWPRNGDLKLRWRRWHKRAIRAAANQVVGAERWIRNFPERIFSDEGCTTKLPVALPPTGVMKVHRIIVASGAKGACRDHFGGLGATQLLGLTTAIDANDIGTLGSEVLGVIAGNLEIGDLANLDTILAGGIFGQVTDQALSEFDSGRLEAALDALDANFFAAGAEGFDGIPGAVTIFDQLSVDSPDALAALLGDEGTQDFFSGALFGSN